MQAKPFHIYDDEFYDIIGSNPTLTLIAETDGDPLFHEATAWCVVVLGLNSWKVLTTGIRQLTRSSSSRMPERRPRALV